MSYKTYIADVTLKIKSIQRSIDFYTRVLGFSILSVDKKSALLSNSKNSSPLVKLIEHENAISKPENATGLYHYAIRLPNVRALADLLINILDHNWIIKGAADHIVSKAIYFSDPDGNGIEIYVDRPRERWEWNNGEIYMSTDRLDIASLLQTASKKSDGKYILHPEAIIGHIHLSVSDLSDAEGFYHDLIGMEVTQRSIPGALFFSFNGYHHHIGVNTWGGYYVSMQPSKAVGLKSFSLTIPDKRIWRDILKRIKDEYTPIDIQILEEYKDGIFINDPSGNGITIHIP